MIRDQTVQDIVGYLNFPLDPPPDFLSTEVSRAAEAEYQAFPVWPSPIASVLRTVKLISLDLELHSLDHSYLAARESRAAIQRAMRELSDDFGALCVDAVSISPAGATLAPGGSVQLAAAVIEPLGTPRSGAPVEWESSDPNVAPVSESGLVRARAPGGTVTITARSGGGSAAATVTVRPPVTFAQIEVAIDGTCALATNGDVFCWGKPIPWVPLAADWRLPTRVAAGYRFRSITRGAQHACGLTGAGSAYCWGANVYGVLGDGTMVDRAVPVPVAGGHRFVELRAGHTHTCGLTDEGRVYCWGRNQTGALGIGVRDNDRIATVPARVAGDHAFVSVSAGGFNTCARDAVNRVYCWGGGTVRNAPDSLMSDRTPEGAPFVYRFAVVETGGWGVWGITPEGVTLSYRYFGPDPIRIADIRFAELRVSYHGMCGRTAEGEVYCIGLNAWFPFGNGMAPVRAGNGMHFSSFGVGIDHMCGIAEGGQAFCWGSNQHGKLGTGSGAHESTPAPVPPSP